MLGFGHNNPKFRGNTDAVVLVIALGLAVAVNLICAAALWSAIATDTALSDNATQVIGAAIGGLVGILGGYVGFRANIRVPPERDDPDESDRP